MPERPELLLAAVQNNAEWCEAVCVGHGLVTEFGRHAWISQERTPSLFPDVVTLLPEATAADVIAPTDTAPADTAAGCTVKDGFARLELADAGFEPLFEATWIVRLPGAAPPPEMGWRPVSTRAELVAWDRAWSASAVGRPEVLHAGLFDDERIRFFGDQRAAGADGPAGGVVANVSGGVVGLSNLFDGGDPAAAWAAAVAAVSASFPGLPIVGYDSGEGLERAREHGFEPLGPLRVWLAG